MTYFHAIKTFKMSKFFICAFLHYILLSCIHPLWAYALMFTIWSWCQKQLQHLQHPGFFKNDISIKTLIGMSLTVTCTRECDGNWIKTEWFIVRLKLRIKWKQPTTLGCHLDSVFCHSSKSPPPHYDASFYRRRRAEDRLWTLVKILSALIDRLCHSLLLSRNLGSEAVLPHAGCL